MESTTTTWNIYTKNKVFDPTKTYLDGFNREWEVEISEEGFWLVKITDESEESDMIELNQRLDGNLYGPSGFVEKNQ